MAPRCPAPPPCGGGHPEALTRPLPPYWAPWAPAPMNTAPIRLPAEVAAHLARFNLALGDLLTGSNPKLIKGASRARGVILHHLPARALARAITPEAQALEAQADTAPRGYLAALAALAAREGLTDLARRWHGCPWATPGCVAGCLAWAGHGGLSPAVAAARGRRTLAMISDPALYGRAILWAICREWERAQAQGLPLAVRLRGTDEGPSRGWHRLRLSLPVADSVALARRFGAAISPGAVTISEALAVMADEGSLHLYDYSKAPVTGPLGLLAQADAGWDVTASLAADRATAAADGLAALAAGFRLAVPVAMAKGSPLPRTLTLAAPGRPPLTVGAVDGDLTDHRWADPSGVAVILRTKTSRGAGPAAGAFSLAPTPEPQALPDGTATLAW